MPQTFDIYMAHAWEDKQRVLPLVRELRDNGLRVWYDDDQLESGRSLRQQLDLGMQASDVGVIVLSKAFFSPRKRWAPMEFDSWLEVASDKQSRLILVWLDVSKEEVRAWSPMAATLFARRFDSTDLVHRIVSDVQSRLVRTGRYSAYLRTNLERHLKWVEPPQFNGSLQMLDEDTSWESIDPLPPRPGSLTPTLPDLFEGVERFIRRPILIFGHQVFQQSLMGDRRWQEFTLQLVTRVPGYQRCLVMVELTKVAPYRLPMPKPPQGHMPLIDGLAVATGGVDFGGGDIWSTVIVHARNLTYVSDLTEGSVEPSFIHWPPTTNAPSRGE